MMIELTPDEVEFLKKLLSTMELSGNREQIRVGLKIVDSILDKLSQQPDKS